MCDIVQLERVKITSVELLKVREYNQLYYTDCIDFEVHK